MGKLRAVLAAVLFLTVLFAAGCTTPKKETLERRLRRKEHTRVFGGYGKKD